MTLSEAQTQEAQDTGSSDGSKIYLVGRQAVGPGFYLFEYGDGRLGWVYSGQMAGLPPYNALSSDDREASDWEVREVKPITDF